MLKAPHLGLCMVIGSLMNAHCLVSLFSVSWLNPGLLISNLPYTFSFFLELAEWRDHSQGNCVLASKGVQCRLKLSLLDTMGKFDARLPREHFQQHLCEPPMQIAVFPWRHWLYSNSRLLLLLLLPGNIQYFIVQLCSGAEQKSAFHLISSHRRSISVCLYVRVYTCTSL